MSGYIGNIPTPQATQTRQTFVATAAQTSFATAGYSVGYLDVFLNGVKLQDGVDYTATNGSDIVLTTGAALDDTLEVVAYTTFEVADVYTKAEADAGFVNVSGDTMTGNLTLGTGLSDTGININHGSTDGTGYGAVRFYEDGVNNTTIHSFPSNWQGGVFPSSSAGSLNLGGLNGVTFGDWQDPRLWIDESTYEVGAKGQLKQFNGNLVIDDDRGTTIAALDTYVMNAGVNYKLARIMTIGDLQRVGTFALMIWMGDGGPHGGGGSHYWNASYSGVITTNNSGTAYNATGPSQLTLNSHYHHTTVAEPTFYLDSDNYVGAGGYGNTNLYINVPVDTQWYNVNIYLKRLAW